MINKIYYSPLQEGGTGGGDFIGNELMIVLDEKGKDFQDYNEKISAAEEEMKQIQQIIINYAGQWVKYQELFTAKKNTIDALEEKYKQLQRENMTAEEQKEYSRKEEEFANMWKDIFGSMGFDQEGARGTFESEEEFFQHQQEENKKKRNANHIKQNISDITGPLVAQLGDMSIKSLWRKIGFLLHPDHLAQNSEISNDEYLKYCEELFKTLQSLYEKKDIGGMIVALQDAGIEYKDGKLIFPSKKERSQIQKKSRLHKQREKLQERLSVYKQSHIYIFYLKLKRGDIDKELRELDDKIQELEDIIASYQTLHNE